MGLLNREKPRATIARVRRSSTNDLLVSSETSLNEIGRALEAYRAGDPWGLKLAVDNADVLREMLIEVHSRHG